MASIEGPEQLSSWFDVWHPNYRPHLRLLCAIGLFGGTLVYLENAALESFVISLGDSSLERGSSGDQVAALGGAALLGLFAGSRLTRVLAGALERVVIGRVKNRTRLDLEEQVLLNLLRKDDQFFADRPPGEILNRLAVDIARISNQRLVRVSQLNALFLTAGNLLFFAQSDWRIAGLAVTTTALGAWWMKRMNRSVAALDRGFLETDDRVKSRFEDMLKASAEIQVGGLFGRASDELACEQSRRTAVSNQYWARDAASTFVTGFSQLLALTALCGAAMYFVSDASPSPVVALVPILIRSLPELFQNAATLVAQSLQLELGRASAERLLEYGSKPRAQTRGTFEIGSSGVPIEFRDATYQYRSRDGSVQGGVSELNLQFAPGEWVAIAGGSGSGKSSLVQLLLGRLSPERGQVTYAGTPLGEIPESTRGTLMTLMPQTVQLLDATIGANLTFGRPDRDVSFSNEDWRILEDVGLAAICREKALEATPRPSTMFVSDIASIRAGIRSRLVDTGIAVLPYAIGVRPDELWTLDCALGGKADAPTALETLKADDARPILQRIAAHRDGQRLVEAARRLLEDQRPLLALSAHDVYARLATNPVSEDVWSLRSDCLEQLASTAAQGDRLLLVALSAQWRDLHEYLPEDGTLALLSDASASALRRMLGDAWKPFDASLVHPHLSWRDNLVFAQVDRRNRRVHGQVDAAITEELKSRDLLSHLTRLGLDYQVGRGGTRLSGGQRQLVSLCRALLRRTPVIVLDEPTSALDPARRDRVIGVLQRWKKGRVVVSVSHDPEFVRASDRTIVLQSGRVAACGPYATLIHGSEALREVMHVS